MKKDTAGNIIQEITPNCDCSSTAGCEKCNPNLRPLNSWGKMIIGKKFELLPNQESLQPSKEEMPSEKIRKIWEEMKLLKQIWWFLMDKCRFCGGDVWEWSDKKAFCYKCGKKQ